jgi:hypothetical protein
MWMLQMVVGDIAIAVLVKPMKTILHMPQNINADVPSVTKCYVFGHLAVKGRLLVASFWH